MDRKEIRNKLKELRSQKDELFARVDACNDVKELTELEKQINGLRKQEQELQENFLDTFENDPEQRGISKPPAGAPQGNFNVLATYGVGGQASNQRSGETMPEISKELLEIYEQRGQALKDGKAVTFSLNEAEELRAVTIGSSGLVVPKHSSPTLSPAFNEVSSLIDAVNAVPLPGGESYKKGFVKGYGEGDYTGETDNYEETDAEFDYVETGKAKITAYSEMSDESQKLPEVNYQAEVFKSIRIALRKKVSKQIVTGLGNTNQIRGIYNAPSNVIPTAGDLELSEIDESTLDKIIFGHGGDEDVEADAYLILNKADLAAFAALRSADGERRLYQIEKNGNTGTISSDGAYKVKFIINSACKALSAESGTEVGDYTMIYGMPEAAYELPLFSDMEVAESKDHKFRQGIICFRGVVWAGGNTCQYKGFTRVKKKA